MNNRSEDKLFENGLLHGADYNPEQWLHMPEVLEEDILLMKKAKCNVMALNIFGWSTIEPKEGVYDFEALDFVMDRLYEEGIYTILATPTGARPNWLSLKYEESNRVTELGFRRAPGQRHNHCYSSPIFRDKAQNIIKKLAMRYCNHPGLILWHVSNEFEGECYCPLCQENFRRWLKKRYKGDIEVLNRAWWTKFWSHTYSSFEQIQAPTSLGENWVHGQNIDWKRFVTDQTIDYMKCEIEVIRAVTPEIPVTTNTHDYVELARGLNYWEVVKHIDIVSWDNYPMWHQTGLSNWEVGARTGFIQDINRSLKAGKPFLMMESSPSATNWQPVAKLLRPGMQNLSGIQAIAHGANSVQYFQWRKSLGSFEKFHGAVVDHHGGDQTRVFKEVAKLGNDLEKISEIRTSRTKSKVAIIYDWENFWGIEDSIVPNENKKDYFQTCVNHYTEFWKAGINTDVVSMDVDFSAYDILVTPMLYMVKAGLGERISDFVKSGGKLVTTYWSGIVDENDLCFRTGRPGPLRAVLGIWSEEIDALYDGEFNEVIMSGSGKSYKAHTFCDLIHLEGAEAMAYYGKDFYKGQPALTHHRFGQGHAYYICSRNEKAFLGDFYKNLIDEYDLKDVYKWDLPEGVTVNTRVDEISDYFILQNYSDQDKKVDLPMNLEGLVDLISGGVVNKPCQGGSLNLGPFGYSVLKISRQ